MNNKELAITIDNPPITLTYDYDDLNNDIDPDFEDIYTGFCPIEINVPIPNFIKKWEYLPMVNYQIEDPTTHETITGTTFTLYDQPISANGKFKVVKWNNFPDNPFYDGLLGEGLVLRKITETPETTDRDWDIQINVQPPLYNLNLGELSVNTGRVITKLPTDYGYDFYGFGSVSYSVNVKYGTLDLGVLRSNNNNEVTIYPVSYNWQYFDAVKYQVQVAQPITTSNFANPNQNITYTLRQLYQGNDNPNGFTPDSTITIAVPSTLYYHAPLNIGELTGNTVQTVTITPQSRGLDYFDDVSYSVNVPQPITVNFTTVVRNNEDYTLSQLYNGQDPIGFTPESTFRVQINPRLLSNVTLNITSNNSTTTLQQLLLDNNIDPTNWNGLDKTCEIHVQVPAEEKLIELEPGQVIPITQNRKRLKYTIYDKDYDSDQDIEFIEEEQPQLLLKRGIVSREIKTRDVNDTSYRNLGNFIIYADINTDTTSITINDNTPLTYSIEQYNQEHGTDYIGFNSITLDINNSEMAFPIDIEKSYYTRLYYGYMRYNGRNYVYTTDYVDVNNSNPIKNIYEYKANDILTITETTNNLNLSNVKKGILITVFKKVDETHKLVFFKQAYNDDTSTNLTLTYTDTWDAVIIQYNLLSTYTSYVGAFRIVNEENNYFDLGIGENVSYILQNFNLVYDKNNVTPYQSNS